MQRKQDKKESELRERGKKKIKRQNRVNQQEGEKEIQSTLENQAET